MRVVASIILAIFFSSIVISPVHAQRTPGRCDGSLYAPTYYECEHTNGTWQPVLQECGTTHRIPGECTGADVTKFGEEVAAQRRFCAPCAPKEAQTLSHGATCNPEILTSICESPNTCKQSSQGNSHRCLQTDLPKGSSCITGESECETLDLQGNAVACIGGTCANTEIVQPDASAPTTEVPPFFICDQTPDAKQQGPDYKKCATCVSRGAVWTAFGCMSVGSPTTIVQDVLRIGLGLSGGFVLLTILYGSFMLSISSGDPKRIQEAQEMISSAVMGLFFIIFSVIILRFIGVSVLRIPGFGG